MRHGILAQSGRWRFAGLSLLYIVVMLYSSTLIGPMGIHFVYRDPAEAFQSFRAITFVAHGSDQRADWVGNLMMLVPLGYLVTGLLWPRRPALRLPAALSAILLCTVVVLAIKYLQLFFPPRTVTLNYVAAQVLGAMIGCACFAVWNEHIFHPTRRRDQGAMLVLVLRLYAAALLLFTLMPLDFAISATDLANQLARLPDTLFALPGSNRPPAIRVVLITMSAAAFIPVGMLLTFVKKGIYRVQRSLVSVMALGIVITTLLYALAALVIGAFPVLLSIPYRTTGVVVGAAAIRWLVRQDPDGLRLRLRRWVPWLVLPYLAGVLMVNRLLSLHWLSVHEALAQLYPLGLLPLFDYYIVTKAEAAKNIVGHTVLYMPVGVMLWLRYGTPGTARAFFVAAAVSFAVEIGRYFRPGLEGDLNAIIVAGLASVLAVHLMPPIWSMMRTLIYQSGTSTKRTWDTRARGVVAKPSSRSVADVEHY